MKRKRPDKKKPDKKKSGKAKPANAKVKARALSAVEERVLELANAMKEHELGELEVEADGIRVRMARAGIYSAQVTSSVAAPSAQVLSSSPAARTETETTDGNTSYIVSPFVGTYYRSPGPDSAPFVDVGTRVKKGQVICIVEAMKLMNEIESEVDGVIAQILVENGHPVEYGEPLFKIKQ